MENQPKPSYDSQARPNSNQPPIAPKQYAKVNAVLQDIPSDSDEDTDEDSEDADILAPVRDALDSIYTRHAYMTRQGTTTSYGTTTRHRLIFDTGADTSIIGKGWEVTHYYGKPINLVGFDTLHARKKGLRACTARTIIEHPNGEKYLLQIHQAVHNPTSEDTLICEYQLSEAGCQIDSKPTHHTFPNGSKGTQSFKLPNKDIIFPLKVESCLLTLDHRKPTLEESETMIPINITSLAEWEPSVYNATPHQVSDAIAVCYHALIHGELEDNIGEEPNEALLEGEHNDLNYAVASFNDPFIQSLGSIKNDMLEKKMNLYDIVSYSRFAFNVSKTIKYKRTKRDPINPQDIQSCLAFLPLETIKHTLNCTTQLAKWHATVPMKRHWKARFPFLNIHRLREPVATDTFFANCKSIGGFTCAQVFFGIQSRMINVYPMRTESDGPHAYEDFLRDEGCPTLLRRDNSKMQTGENFTSINRHFCIKDGLTEPYHPQQNPAENQAVKWLKSHAQVVMNISGAPEYAWADCMLWIADVHNVVANDSLNLRTPYETRHGSTPDISAYILFTFWEKILYYDSEQSFPNSKELPGHFLGVAKNSGDALTFRILDSDGKVLVRSVIRSALGKPLSGFPNKRVTHPEEDYKAEPPYPNHDSSVVGHNGGDIQPSSDTSNGLFDDSDDESVENAPSATNNNSGNNKKDPDTEDKTEETRVEVINDFVDLTKPREGKPDVTRTRGVPSANHEPHNDKKQTIVEKMKKAVRFSDKPIEIDQTISHTKKKKKKKFTHNIFEDSNKRRSARNNKNGRKTKNSSQNIVTTRRSGFYELLSGSLAMLGMLLVTNMPMFLDSAWNKQDPKSKLEDIVETWDDWAEIKEDPKHRKLQYYHHILDELSEVEDSEDEYQNYVWKVDKIVSHKRRGRQIFLHVIWKPGNNSWISLKSLRFHDPYSCVMYAVKHKLLDESDWDWTKDFIDETSEYTRLLHALRTSKNFGPKYKFGIEVPRSVKHALLLDKIAGNNLWAEAIKKELDQFDEFGAFRFLGEGESIEDFQRLPYHMVFDVKFDLRRKARLVVGGDHQTGPKDESYSGVVSLTTIRILFLLATINGLHLWAADVGNAFLNGITRDKLYIIAGPEFGPHRSGKPLIMYKSIYGARASCARFHEHLSERLLKLGFKPSKADPDLWFKDVGTHYEYIGTYVDDLLIASKDPQKIIDELKKIYTLKGVGIPEYYLGADIIEAPIEWKAEPIDWIIASKTYTRNVITKFEELMSDGKSNYAFAEYKTPMDSNYHPELDDSPILDAEQHSRFRSMVGSLNWIITIGRFDIQFAVTTLARYSQAPRQGHLKALIRVFGYLKKFRKGKLLIDPTLPDHLDYPFDDLSTWRDLYPEAEEEIPYDCPKPKGTPVRITIFVDADHARDKVTCRSITGILVMINNCVVKSYSKKQSTVESSTYGSELVAARIATDMAVEIRYILQMLGVAIDGSVLMLGDNKSVVVNTTIPSSALKKKNCAIAYHRVREAIAARIIRFCHIDTRLNVADVLTKPLPNTTFHHLVRPLLFRQPGEPRWPTIEEEEEVELDEDDGEKQE